MEKRRNRAASLAVALPFVAAAVVAVVALTGDDARPPVELSSGGPTFLTIDELIGASDLIVVASVAEVSAGRIITAAERPDAGIRTRLVELDVTRTLLGVEPVPLVVEEAAELLDRSPVIVDGIDELATGDNAVWFLVAGSTEALPYHAAVNGQGRYRIFGNALQSAESDPLSTELAALGAEGLVHAILDRT